MTAIYGQLFELGTGGAIVPDLATGYSFSPDGKTLTINLRQGVTFTDGTPFNAQAVYTNWMRDLGTIGIRNGFNSPWPIAELPAPQERPARARPSRPPPGSSRSPGLTRSSFTSPRRTAPRSTSSSTTSKPGSPRRPP